MSPPIPTRDRPEREGEPLVLSTVERVRNEFVAPDGVMDWIAIRWLRRVLAEERRSVIVTVETGGHPSVYARRTGERYRILDYGTVADFLDEPSGTTLAIAASAEGLAAERWETVAIELYANSLLAWLRENGLERTLLDRDGLIDDGFWTALSASGASCEGWLARFGARPLASVPLSMVTSPTALS